MLARTLALAALVASVASAYQISSPDNTTTWSSSASSQSVQYESVSSDASTFAVVLVQNSAQVATLEQNVTKQDSATLTLNAPSGGWPTGEGFQVNFVRSTQESNSILAQSGRFVISNNGAAASSSSSAASSSSSAASSSASSSTSSASRTTSSGVVASASSAVAGDASGGIPNSSPTPSGAASALTASNALLAGVVGAVGYLVGL